MDLDKTWLGLVGTLMLFGAIMVTSASIGIAERDLGSPFFYATRHVISLGLGILGGTAAFFVPLSWWQRSAFALWIVGMLLLVLVLIPPIGISINGARRWLPLGIMTFQASEFMKLAFILFLAQIIDLMRWQLIQQRWAFLKPVALLVLVMGLLLLEPDFGAAAVIALTAAAMLFLSGVPLGPYCALGAISAIMMAGVALIAPYRVARLTAFVDPWADQFDTGYQLTQALIAFGRGES